MTTPRDPETVVAAWLEEGPTALPEQNRRAITTAVHSITQRRRGFGSPWRETPMTGFTRLAVAAAAVVIAAVGGIYLLSPGQPSGGVGGPGASPTPTPTPTQTPRPSPVATEAGTITLTDEGCTWIGNPSPITQPVLLTIDVVNETDTFASFDLHRLTAGTWDDAAAWIRAEHEALQTGGENPLGPADFAEQITDEFDAVAFAQSRLTQDVRIPGTYGIICSSNEPPPGEVFGVYLVGPLVIE
jgi:hypothetical protein